MNQLDQIVGLGSITTIRELVKLCYFDSGLKKVCASLVFGILFNVAIAILLGNSWIVGVCFGIVAGFLSNLYNDYKSSI